MAIHTQLLALPHAVPTPVQPQAFKRKPEAVAVLLQYGANTLVLDRKGRTPAEDTKDMSIRAAILEARAAALAGTAGILDIM